MLGAATTVGFAKSGSQGSWGRSPECTGIHAYGVPHTTETWTDIIAAAPIGAVTTPMPFQDRAADGSDESRATPLWGVAVLPALVVVVVVPPAADGTGVLVTRVPPPRRIRPDGQVAVADTVVPMAGSAAEDSTVPWTTLLVRALPDPPEPAGPAGP